MPDNPAADDAKNRSSPPGSGEKKPAAQRFADQALRGPVSEEEIDQRTRPIINEEVKRETAMGADKGDVTGGKNR